MADLSFRSALLTKDRETCNKFIVNKFDLDVLVQLLNDLMYVSASIKKPLVNHYHPICIINSIKNIIGHNRENPSHILLKFGILLELNFIFFNESINSVATLFWRY